MRHECFSVEIQELRQENVDNESDAEEHCGDGQKRRINLEPQIDILIIVVVEAYESFDLKSCFTAITYEKQLCNLSMNL